MSTDLQTPPSASATIGSVSGPTRTGRGVPKVGRFASDPAYRSTATPVLDTTPDPVSFERSTSSAPTTPSPSNTPTESPRPLTTLETRASAYVPGEDVDVPAGDLRDGLEQIATGLGMSLPQLINRIVVRIMGVGQGHGAHWGDSTLGDVLKFYTANFWIPAPKRG